MPQTCYIKDYEACNGAKALRLVKIGFENSEFSISIIITEIIVRC